MVENNGFVKYYLFRKRSGLQPGDLIWGPEPDGSYEINLNNVMIVGLDASGKPYKMDQTEKIIGSEPVYFEEVDSMRIAAARSFDDLLEKFDRKIQKRLVWVDDVCVGIL